MVIKLDPNPARQLTDRECAKILGGTIGALAQMAPPDVVFAAVKWWVDNPQALSALAAMGKDKT